MKVSFNRVAPFYDTLVYIVYGNTIRHAQCFFLPEIIEKSSVLILGGGTGWILKEISKSTLKIEIDYVEHSEVMLRKAKEYKSLPFSRLNFVLGTEGDLGNRKYDFIITPFVLDVFAQEPMEQMVCRVNELLGTEGRWLCVDFNSMDRSFKAKMLSICMLLFFRVVSGLKTNKVLDYFGTIQKTGLIEVKSRLFFGSFIKASLYKKEKGLEI